MKNHLREIREQKNMSQAELSRASGVSRPTIIKIENEQANMEIKVSTLEKLAAALNETVGAVFF